MHNLLKVTNMYTYLLVGSIHTKLMGFDFITNFEVVALLVYFFLYQMRSTLKVGVGHSRARKVA